MTRGKKLWMLRWISKILIPVRFVFQTLSVSAAFIVSSVATFIALYGIKEDLVKWFPVLSVRLGEMILFSVSVGIIAAIPSFREVRTRTRLRKLIVDEYLGYVVAILQDRMDKKIDQLRATYQLGQLTMSIMIPFGDEVLVTARSLKIVVASRLLLPYPSMNLTLDWGEGVAGTVWSGGLLAKELAVKNSPSFFKENGIAPISKRPEGSFGHQSGICFPVTTVTPEKRTGEFLGLLNIGSSQENDYDIFNRADFQMDIYEFIHASLKEGIGLLRIKRIE